VKTSFEELFENNPYPMWSTTSNVGVPRVSTHGHEPLRILARSISGGCACLIFTEKLTACALTMPGSAKQHRTSDGRIIDVEMVSHALDFCRAQSGDGRRAGYYPPISRRNGNRQ